LVPLDIQRRIIGKLIRELTGEGYEAVGKGSEGTACPLGAAGKGS